jgi:hypothetical protein
VAPPMSLPPNPAGGHGATRCRPTPVSCLGSRLRPSERSTCRT